MINNKFVYVKLTNIFSLILILESNFGQSYGFKWGLPRWFCGKEGALSGATGDSDSILWLGRYPGGGNSNLVQCSFFFFFNIYLFICRVLITRPPGRSLLQYPCLGNPMDRGAWWAAESMCLQTNVFGFFWSENVDRVHKMLPTSVIVAKLVKWIQCPNLTLQSLAFFTFLLFLNDFCSVFISHCPILHCIKKPRVLWGYRHDRKPL